MASAPVGPTTPPNRAAPSTTQKPLAKPATSKAAVSPKAASIASSAPQVSAMTRFVQKLFSSGHQPPIPDQIANEQLAFLQHEKLLHRLTKQSILIAIAAIVFVMALPLVQTRYHYSILTPDHRTAALVPLTMPNLTDGAVRAWAATSVTEIMTFGFGDMDSKLVAQKHRFTPDGWTDFVHVFLDKKIGAAFLKSQLVLTTVPSSDPEIVSQAVNAVHIYEWKIKVPIIMTYATNNNVTKPEKGTITLTVVRVPYDENNAGLAIQSWGQR